MLPLETNRTLQELNTCFSVYWLNVLQLSHWETHAVSSHILAYALHAARISGAESILCCDKEKDGKLCMYWVYTCILCLGEQGWRIGESARLPPVWPRFDSRTRRHMWVEFVVGSLLAPRGFSPGTPVFLPPPPPLPHQCGPGLIPGPGVICGLSLLLVLSLFREVFLWVLWSSSQPLPPSPTSVARVRIPDPASFVS